MTINEYEARALAAGWISSRDVELTRFATGHRSKVDWTDFLAELDLCAPYASKQCSDQEAADAHRELDLLTEYAKQRLNEGN